MAQYSHSREAHQVLGDEGEGNAPVFVTDPKKGCAASHRTEEKSPHHIPRTSATVQRPHASVLPAALVGTIRPAARRRADMHAASGSSGTTSPASRGSSVPGRRTWSPHPGAHAVQRCARHGRSVVQPAESSRQHRTRATRAWVRRHSARLARRISTARYSCSWRDRLTRPSFIGVDEGGTDVEIPTLHQDIPELAYLGGHRLSELLDI